MENQLLGWLQKFDQDIGEKQAEEEEVQGHLDEEKKQLEKIQVRYPLVKPLLEQADFLILQPFLEKTGGTRRRIRRTNARKGGI